uniref:Glucose dehydrogenase [FAD, quinone]-like n=1 Tax=Hirondellea gigas TaxID=1518452 RepID=A0A6A7FRT3_9CRUS
MMGGNTGMNGMVYVRGNRNDYDNWANMGNHGWDYDSIFHYFLKSENFKGTLLSPADGAHHSTGGPVSVESRRTITAVTPTMIEVAAELGYPIVDGTGPEQIGMAPLYTTTRDGVRASASENFLRPIIHKPNLRVTAKAFVTKVLFDKKKRAVGVEYDFKGKRRVVLARKEVILSAGALNTPKLLMLSGVGPPQHLTEMGIPVVAPVEGVGGNLMDHANIYLTWRVRKGTSTSLWDLVSPKTILDYLKNRRGLLSDTIGLECNLFVNIGGGEPSWSDMQLSIASLSYAIDRGLLLVPAVDMKPEIYNNLYEEFFNDETLTINPCLLRPKSRGSVRLASSNPFDNPVADINYFDHPDDMKLMIKGVRLAIKIGNTEAVKRNMGAEFQTKLLSPCKHHGADTDEYWECFIRYTVQSIWHYAGTAKMAPKKDPMGVVSERLRVRGVHGLRVVDASIMPLVATSNTMAPTYMIAEKASDMIKQDWGYPT